MVFRCRPRVPVTTVPPATDRPPRPPFLGRQTLPATPRAKPAAAWSGQVIDPWGMGMDGSNPRVMI